MLRSALIVEVPGAELAVARWRAQFDPQASLGVPAHVTVLFPFAAPDSINEPTLATLRNLLLTAAAFKFQLARSAWFDDRVLWLAPEPAEPFQRLTRLVAEAFPGYPPYGGQYTEVVPHLTVADHGTPDQLRTSESAVRGHLPIVSTADAVSLMVEHSDGRWERHTTFPLAAYR